MNLENRKGMFSAPKMTAVWSQGGVRGLPTETEAEAFQGDRNTASSPPGPSPGAEEQPLGQELAGSLQRARQRLRLCGPWSLLHPLTSAQRCHR